MFFFISFLAVLFLIVSPIGMNSWMETIKKTSSSEGDCSDSIRMRERETERAKRGEMRDRLSQNLTPPPRAHPQKKKKTLQQHSALNPSQRSVPRRKAKATDVLTSRGGGKGFSK